MVSACFFGINYCWKGRMGNFCGMSGVERLEFIWNFQPSFGGCYQPWKLSLHASLTCYRKWELLHMPLHARCRTYQSRTQHQSPGPPHHNVYVQMPSQKKSAGYLPLTDFSLTFDYTCGKRYPFRIFVAIHQNGYSLSALYWSMPSTFELLNANLIEFTRIQNWHFHKSIDFLQSKKSFFHSIFLSCW